MRELRGDDVQAVLALAARPQLAPLRYLRLFGHDIGGQEQHDRVARALKGDGTHLVLETDGRVAAQASIAEVRDLTDHFDVPFHEVGPVLVDPRSPVPRALAAQLLLEALVDSVAGTPPGVVMLRLESDDGDGLLGAEEAGFRIRETSLTYVNDLERRHRNGPVDLGDTIRVHRFADGGPLEREFIDRVKGDASRVAMDHYHADPRLPDAACDALYERLLERLLHGVGSDVLIMRIHEGEPAGMGTWRHWSEAEPYGVSMAGSSFGFRIGSAPPGLLNEVTDYVCNESITGNRLLEWSTQAANLPMANMIARPNSIRLCRTSHVLHRWTDGQWA